MKRKCFLVFAVAFGIMGLAQAGTEMKDLKPLYKARTILIVAAKRERSLGKISKGDADYPKLIAAMRRLRSCPIQQTTSDISLRFYMDDNRIYFLRYDAKKHYLETGGIDTPEMRAPIKPRKAWKTTPELERIIEKKSKK